MAASREAAGTVKVAIVLDAGGQIAGLFKPTDYQPAKEGDERDVTVGVTAAPGQSLLEVEVPAATANLDAPELLAHLAEHRAVKDRIAATPTAGMASIGSSQAPMLATSVAAVQSAIGVSAGQVAEAMPAPEAPITAGITAGMA